MYSKIWNIYIGGGTGGQGACSPPNKNWGGAQLPHVLVPKISLAQHKNLQNIQSRDHFTNRFTSIALGEIICCKTFDAVRTGATRCTSGDKYTDQVRGFQHNCCHENTVRRSTQTFSDVFDVTSSIRDFRTHISCPQTTQELPKKHYEAGPPEQLPNDTFSQIDYGHTRHCNDCKKKRFACANELNAQGILENLSWGMRMTG